VDDATVIAATRRWVESMVVALNLCPFAQRELTAGRVRFAVTSVVSEDQLLAVLQAELEMLTRDPAVETTLLIHPAALAEFFSYNQFLELADRLLVALDLEGVYQVASFHPDYQFFGTDRDDAENFTNRSPYPMLHLLREDSLHQVISEFPDVDQIPARNIVQMNSLGKARLQRLLQACSAAGLN
jgi:hypothetical protein